MYELIRRLTVRQLTLEQLPLLLIALVIAETFYKFHSFLLETGAFLLTWLALGAMHAGLKALLTRTQAKRSWRPNQVAGARETPDGTSTPRYAMRRPRKGPPSWAMHDQTDNWSRNGRRRMRFPVAALIAFIKAGAITGTPGSPTPPGGMSYDSEGRMWTTIRFGAVFMRTISYWWKLSCCARPFLNVISLTTAWPSPITQAPSICERTRSGLTCGPQSTAMSTRGIVSSPQASGVIFHAAAGLDANAIAQMQAQVRQRLLRVFVRRGLLPEDDARAMAQ